MARAADHRPDQRDVRSFAEIVTVRDRDRGFHVDDPPVEREGDVGKVARQSVDPLVSVKNPGAGFYDEAWHTERKGQGSKEFKTWRAFSLEHLGNGA